MRSNVQFIKCILLALLVSLTAYAKPPVKIANLGFDKRTVTEMYNDFLTATAPFRACEKNSDCSIEKAGCRAIGVNKKHIQEFRTHLLNLPVTCGGRDICKSVTCQNKTCKSSNCTNHSI